jgi:hypothetical protein
VIQERDVAEDFTDFLGGEDDGEFELGIGADQFDLGGPGPAEGFFPEEFDGADGLGGGLAGEFLFGLEMEEVMAQFLRGDHLGGFMEELAEFADAGPITEDGALGQGQETQVVEEAV